MVEGGKMRATDARDKLEQLGVNRNSALDFVYIFRHMLRGEIYKRAMSADATEDFVTWIRRDYGERAFRNSLSALSLHIPYNGGAMKGHRALLQRLEMSDAKVSADEAGPNRTNDDPEAGGIIEIRWSDKESSGYRDLFPIDTFAHEGSGKTIIHDVVGPRGGVSSAKCRITIKGVTAELDYRPFSRFNLARGMLLGVVRLTFIDEDRTEVRHVDWKVEGSNAFTPASFEPARYRMPPIKDYAGPGRHARRVLTTVRERKGQSAFRKMLKRIYNNSCCVTECAVSQTLEGAHIDEFEGPDSDHPQNGLLLRRDIHALFDANLMGINPRTRIVFFAPEVLSFPEYSRINGATVIRTPTVGGASYYPSAEALERRWLRFQGKTAKLIV
jgi:hypothetical protein